MWPNPQETADLVTFTEEILNEKLQFLWSDFWFKKIEEVIHVYEGTRDNYFNWHMRNC